ncbi:hypothetical protein GCM10007416_25630 [Kroppenstedtia guangzhouensis]|jgi:hypothetical protein|uniref:Uncharacterized protein n=1 Tax=Kroppenstedtia guangzhouensis TaxID=1274356 RepID=A0ABQ1GWI6_9BACL|nr:hypothetical protein [Kroppenstedtia guangzhouensis]GGA51377.1 hypothetical protein GCM10007416_25630 [Kroppenstedtia guangzhouensis]
MKSSRRLRLLRMMVTFLFGVLAGSSAMNLLYGKKLDALYLERNILIYRNNEKSREINTLRKDLDRHSEPRFIRRIPVEVDSSDVDNEFVQERIRERVQQILQPFLGKPIHWVKDNPDVVDNMLKDRLLPIQQDKETHHLKVRLKYLVFNGSDEMKIWITVNKNQEKNVSIGRK